MEDQFYYSDIHNNQLLQLLKEPEFASALAYLVDFKNYAHLTITPHNYSIEISNNEITIAIILFSGFEVNEYLTLRNKNNLNLISLSEIIPKMCEFENMHVKYIDKLTWFFSAMNRSENDFVKKLCGIKNLRVD